MLQITKRMKGILALTIAGMFATTSPVMAEKPPWAGGGGDKDWKHERQQERHDNYRGRDGGYSHGHDRHERGDMNVNVYFGDHHRQVIRNYYTERYHSGRCPPGLYRKGNGCLPPGHARRWYVGRPLPREVVYYDLPPEVVVQLGPPPTGHRFVRVASDVLLIAVGTGMVVDAIQDLNGY